MSSVDRGTQSAQSLPKKPGAVYDPTWKFRVVILSVLFLVLIALLLSWNWLRSWSEPPAEIARQTVWETSFTEPEYQPTATSEQLLALADREILALLQQYPSSAEAFNAKANRDYLISDMDAARESWTQAARLDPSSDVALFGLANLAFQEGEYAQAIGLCQEVQRLKNVNPRVPLLLADSFLHAGDPENAALTLEQHIASEPSSRQAWEMLGNAYLQTDNPDRAIQCFETALRYSPNSKDALFGMSRAYAAKRDRDKAQRYSELFRKIASETGEEHQDQAQAFRDRDYAAHIAAQVFIDSAQIYKTQGDLEQAADRTLKGLKLQPDVIAWLEELQRLYASLDQRWNAVDVGQRLVELQPDNVEYQLNLGQLYAELEQSELAISTFEKAIELAPDDPRCKRAQAVISRLQQT
ncbi:MAG: tetratricopeptide repeat protein [bacterium]|nr:tetratricopeptide repeat protein [bacterium]